MNIGQRFVLSFVLVALGAAAACGGAGQADCGGACVDLGSEPSSCGACGVVCGDGATCKNGVCK
jgi:hypothetical protein